MKDIWTLVSGLLVRVAPQAVEAMMTDTAGEVQRLRDAVTHRDHAAWWTDAGGARRCSYCAALENCCRPGCPRVDYPRAGRRGQ
jgi:hypothetical protein